MSTMSSNNANSSAVVEYGLSPLPSTQQALAHQRVSATSAAHASHASSGSDGGGGFSRNSFGADRPTRRLPQAQRKNVPAEPLNQQGFVIDVDARDDDHLVAAKEADQMLPKCGSDLHNDDTDAGILGWIGVGRGEDEEASPWTFLSTSPFFWRRKRDVGCSRGGFGVHDPRCGTSRIINPIFNKDGAMNVYTIDPRGNKTEKKKKVRMGSRLWTQEWYFALISAPWKQVMFGSFCIWLLIGMCIAALYYFATWACDAQPSVILSVYFNVVSLAANGGYVGEHPTMLDPHNHPKCFQARSAIVMAASYLNILCVGFIAAITLAKASAPASMRHRIIFSDIVVAREIHTPSPCVVLTPPSPPPADSSPAAATDGSPSQPNLPSSESLPTSAEPQQQQLRPLKRRRLPHSVLVAEAFKHIGAGEEGSGNGRTSNPKPEPGMKTDLSYLLQFRVGNLAQAGDGGSVLSGELHVYLVVMEVVNMSRRAVRSRCYELPWVALEENHDEDDDSSSGSDTDFDDDDDGEVDGDGDAYDYSASRSYNRGATLNSFGGAMGGQSSVFRRRRSFAIGTHNNNDTNNNNLSASPTPPFVSGRGSFLGSGNINGKSNSTRASQKRSRLPSMMNSDRRAKSGGSNGHYHASDFNASSKSLRLWFPASASIAVGPNCKQRSIRLLYNLLLRHSRSKDKKKNKFPADSPAVAAAVVGDSSMATAHSQAEDGRQSSHHFTAQYAKDASIENIFEFQLVVEYQAQDSKTGGASFVARHSYAPSDILRNFKFSEETCAFLTDSTYSRIVRAYGGGGADDYDDDGASNYNKSTTTKGTFWRGHQQVQNSYSANRRAAAILASVNPRMPSFEVDFTQFNMVEPDD